ncbi:glycosyltransferase family 4 protein [Brevibacillus humidisoli]|uniref:glycosyltransferase family 4 protein n=1 Tax=Brevibacillus humidisoli TaxID=2895522 RepID=UPI001E5EA044|nr:glycosyltransferase family 4 protein [Brevibacillus humidisoli]UFJ39154.1 glycosyltransferase family 4 protein [Brevibacillus humidisoli]
MTRNKHVLMIAYAFPPIGGGGVPRPLKMAKYLGEFGWNVHVLTVDPSYHATLDRSLLAEVPEQVKIYRAKEIPLLPKPAPAQATDAGRPSGSHPSLTERIKQQVVSVLKKAKPYLLIPDENILWYPAAVRLGREIMRREKIDVIFSTSGPATDHLVALKLAESFPCKWIVDFRDPWTQNMHRSGILWRERLEERMEARVMERADALTTVTATFAENFRQKYGSLIKRLELIYNGFDRADFAHLGEVPRTDEKFRAVYAGIFYQKRNPRLLLEAVKELIDEGRVQRDEILLSFAGVFDYPGYSDNVDCVKRLGLSDVVEVLGNLPHKEALGLMKSADTLLLVSDVSPDAGAYIPGKLYEYMGVGKPILALNMPGEATEIIERFGLGQVADPTDKAAIKQAYLQLYEAWRRERQSSASITDIRLPADDMAERVKPYERREQARQLARLMDELIEAQD